MKEVSDMHRKRGPFLPPSLACVQLLLRASNRGTKNSLSCWLQIFLWTEGSKRSAEALLCNIDDQKSFRLYYCKHNKVVYFGELFMHVVRVYKLSVYEEWFNNGVAIWGQREVRLCRPFPLCMKWRNCDEFTEIILFRKFTWAVPRAFVCALCSEALIFPVKKTGKLNVKEWKS